MAVEPFEFTVRLEEHCVILDLKGDLTKTSEQMLLEAYEWEKGLEGARPFLVLNFTDVSYINSMGIAQLIRLVLFGKKGGFQTLGYGISSHYQKLFRMVGLTEYMLFCPSEYNAMQRIEHYINPSDG